MLRLRSLKRIAGTAAAAMLTAGLAVAQPGTAPSIYNDNDLLNQNGFGNTSPTPFNPMGAGPQTTLPANVDVTAVRRGLQSAATDASALYDSLDRQSRYVPAIRPLMADVIKLRARSARLANSIITMDDLTRALPDLKALDGDWRLLSNKLKLASGLDRTTLGLVTALDATDDALARSLQLAPSVNYRDLIQQTSALSSAMDRLMDDIGYELGATSQSRELILQAQKVSQQAKHLSDFAFAQTDYDHLVQDFKLFEQFWAPLASTLRTLDNRWIERDVQRVQQTERDITATLLLQQTLDPQQLVFLTQTLQADVDTFFGKAPLKMLMRLPESQQALPTADEFYGVFENFIDCVKRGETREELIDAFRYIDGSWKGFNRVYRPLNSTEAQAVLTSIDKDIATLRGALLITEGFDRTKASELAATIENLAGHLQRDTQSWLSKARPAYQSEAQREVGDFLAHARELHEAIATGVNMREVRQMSDALFDSWRRVYGYVIRCQTGERAYLASTSSQTTPALVELRTLLAK